jgi:hypothetical protein
MKTLVMVLLMLLVIAGCPGQVVVPPANIQPALDSIAVLRARVILAEARVTALEARPVVTFNGSAADYLNGSGQWKKAVEVITGTGAFVGTTNWRKAIYVPGITSAWFFSVTPVYTTDSPAVDFLVPRWKTDSLIVLRQPTGTNNLVFTYTGILP